MSMCCEQALWACVACTGMRSWVCTCNVHVCMSHHVHVRARRGHVRVCVCGVRACARESAWRGHAHTHARGVCGAGMSKRARGHAWRARACAAGCASWVRGIDMCMPAMAGTSYTRMRVRGVRGMCTHACKSHVMHIYVQMCRCAQARVRRSIEVWTSMGPKKH